MAENDVNIAEIRAALEREGAGWQAGETSLTQLPHDERIKRLGAVPPPGEPSIEEVARRALARRGTPPTADRAANAPAAFDWRNAGGRNFVTPVKDQGDCGSCVAFGTAAAIETTLRVQRNDPNLEVNLSEAHLFYCNGRAQGRNCANGWWPDQALETCKTIGIADDACYPYTAGDQDCTGRCGDWQSRVTKVTGYRQLSGRAEIQEWLSTRGSLAACFVVFNDFFSYRSGVYRHVSGNAAGGHCVELIGYDNGQNCWICKNSWGTAWGDAGYFRIGYGECEIETWSGPMAVDGVQETGWLTNKTVVGLWAINEDRNAWVLVSDVGWRRIAPDNDNIFFDMLVHLTTAKTANRPINVYQDQGVIRQVYVF